MDFDALLEHSISAVNASYELAVNDINGMIKKIGDAVQRKAGDRFAVVLREIYADLKGSTFRVYFDTNVNRSRARLIDVVFIRVPANGYPILLGTVDKNTEIFISESTIENARDLEEYFSQLLRNPESRLIQAIAFAIRSHTIEDEISF